MHYISIPVFSLQIHIKMVLHHIPVFIYHLLIGRSRSGNTVRLIFCCFIPVCTAVCYRRCRVILLKLQIQDLIIFFAVIVKIYIQVAEKSCFLLIPESHKWQQDSFHFIIIKCWFNIPIPHTALFAQFFNIILLPKTNLFSISSLL